MYVKPLCLIKQNMTAKKLHKSLALAMVFMVFLLTMVAYRSHTASQDLPIVENTEALECWDKFLMEPPKIKKNYIPTTSEEAPEGFAPTIPEEFLIEEEDYCSKRPSLWVIAYVHTSIKNTERRDTTRKTWGSASKLMGVVYVVGRAKDEKEAAIVKRESDMYHDIVQGNYTDLYRLLDYKALNSLHWVTKNCGRVPWVVHADDDVMIDVFQLLGTVFMLSKNRRYNEIFCGRYFGSPTNREGRYSVKLNEYPCESYPPYCSGPAWFISIDAARVLLKTVPLVKFLWVDDAYLTGLVALKGGIQLTEVKCGDSKVRDEDLGKTLLWLNDVSNRTAEWSNILNYYKHQKSTDIYFKE